MIKVDNVSMKFRMNGDRIQSLKELTIAVIKRNLSYKDFWVFRDVSFEVAKGEVVGIIGRNGAGKSTLLKIISGILTPTEGKVTLNGKVVPMLELGSGFDFELTGRENIYLNGAILGYSEEFLKEKYDEIVEFSELGEFIETPIRNYSSGMMMRLAFSIATIVQPEILIVDEILAVGDEAFQRKSKRKMLELMGGGTTVLFVSHSIGQIREMCNRVIWLEDGKVKMKGETKLICDEYQRYLDPAFGKEDKNQKASQAMRNLSDVLFIYGGNGKEHEWRVDYQREQLVINGVASNEISEDDVNKNIAKMYRVFICVGCHNTEIMQEVLREAKKFNKKVFFDFCKFAESESHLESQRQLLSDLGMQVCDGVIVSNEKLENEFQEKGFQVYRNPLALNEDMYKYAEWAVYDRDVLPYCDTKYLTDDELINFNRAKQTLKVRKENGVCTYFKIFSNGDNDCTLKEDVIEILDRISELKLLAVTKSEKEDYEHKFENRLIHRSYTEKQDIFRIYADIDFLILVGWDHNCYDQILEHLIYAAAVKTPSVIIADSDKIGYFSNGEDVFICKSMQEMEDTILYLIKNKNVCRNVAEKAYVTTYSHHSTVKTGDALGQFIRENMTKNICYVTTSREICGQQWTILHHAVLMKEKGYDISLLTQGSNQDNIIFDGFEIPVISRDIAYSFQNIDFAVAVDIDAVRWVQDYTKIKKRSYFVQGNEVDYTMVGDVKRLSDNQMYTPYADLHYVSSADWIKEWLEEHYSQDSIVVPNGISYDKLVCKKESWDNKLKVLFIGNRQNNADHFDEALKIIDQLNKNYYEIYIYLYGKGKLDGLEEYTVLKNLKQEEVFRLFRECHILLCTMENEEHQQTALEMMAAGGTVVLRKSKGMKECYIDAVNCSIYSQNNVGEAVDKIEQIRLDKKHRDILIKNGEKLARQHDWKYFDQDIVSIYQ